VSLKTKSRPRRSRTIPTWLSVRRLGLEDPCLFEGAYDPGVVTDKVPDEQLCETRDQDDGKGGVCRPNPISEVPGATTPDSRRYIKDGDGEDGKLS